MASHNEKGWQGEKLAASYLAEKGYKIIEINWRFKFWEIDIIAEKNGVLQFIEVKTRQSAYYGYPEQSVGKKKLRFIVNAAEQYLYLHPQWQRIRFNILSIICPPKGEVAYFLIEDITI
ncbi:MAG: YraN family protein [Ferruginibacter sp.]